MYPKQPRVKTVCKNCSLEFESKIKENRVFCSSNCSATYNNKTRIVKRKIKKREYSQVGKVSDCKPDILGSNPSTLSRVCKHCGKDILNIKKGYQCDTCISRIRRFELKKKAVSHKGGKCEKCGYDKHLAALEFHHPDPLKKDFTISKKHNYKWIRLVDEIDKCILLCSNCHRIEHSKYNEFI